MPKTTFLKDGARMEGTTMQPLSKSTKQPSYYRLQQKEQREKKAKLQKEKSKKLAVWIRRALRFLGFSKPEKEKPLQPNSAIVK